MKKEPGKYQPQESIRHVSLMTHTYMSELNAAILRLRMERKFDHSVEFRHDPMHQVWKKTRINEKGLERPNLKTPSGVYFSNAHT